MTAVAQAVGECRVVDLTVPPAMDRIGAEYEGYADTMNSDDVRTVRGQDLRRLLDSDLPDPTLVLVEGRVEVVPGDRESGGLEIVSRETLLRRAGRSEFTDTELEQQSAMLSAAVDNLGG
ncbi:hypothetical protein [Actinophytocola sp.]|uniref:hypothetical protein n=1 Tax=Actinophytocola sp. TaxID=1872138 RepID=UPI003899C7D3